MKDSVQSKHKACPRLRCAKRALDLARVEPSYANGREAIKHIAAPFCRFVGIGFCLLRSRLVRVLPQNLWKRSGDTWQAEFLLNVGHEQCYPC